MTWINTKDKYGAITKFLHWLIFVCILANVLIGFFRKDIASKAMHSELMMIHKSIGLTLIVLSVLFIVNAWFSRKPDWPVDMAGWEKVAARLVHGLLYVVILVMALSGWCMSTAAGYPSPWFGVFTVMAPWVPHSKPLAHVFSQIHSACAWIIVVLAGIHILAALKHQFLDKDHVLRRMLPM